MFKTRFLATFMILLVIVTLALILMAPSVQAATEIEVAPGVTVIQPAEDTTGPTFADFLAKLPALGGFAVLFSFVIGLMKTKGWIQDGQAPMWNAIFNFVLLGITLLLGYLKLPITIEQIDQGAGILAQLGTLVLLYIAQMGTTKGTYLVTKGAPVIGASNTQLQIKTLLADQKPIS